MQSAVHNNHCSLLRCIPSLLDLAETYHHLTQSYAQHDLLQSSYLMVPPKFSAKETINSTLINLSIKACVGRFADSCVRQRYLLGVSTDDNIEHKT
jgi:hypothetical protein